MGELAWFCFKAHCSTRGRDTVRRTIEDITSALLFTKESYDVPFTVPEHFVGISDRPHVERYFKSVNVYDMYRNMQIMLMYDPKQDRAVFLIERDGRIVDGVGRALSPGFNKWYRYGNSGRSYLYSYPGRRSVIVVTEDIPSACTVGYSYDAFGLLGTELSSIDMVDLMCYTKVIIALDPDAYSKGVKMASRLSPFVDAQAIQIPDDLKYFTPNQVKEMINGYLATN
jgi:hypothetical protein